MNHLILLVAAVLIVQAGLAEAGICRQIEYAEVQDMSAKDLIKTYCADQALGMAVAEEYQTTVKMEDKIGSQPGYGALLRELSAHLAECTATVSKNRTALKKRAVEEPQCNMKTGEPIK